METMGTGSLSQRNLFLQWKHLMDHTCSLQTRFEELQDRFHLDLKLEPIISVRGTKRGSVLVQNDIEKRTERLNLGVKSLDEKSRELKMKEVIELNGRRLNAIKGSIKEVMKDLVSKQEQVKVAQKSLEEWHEEIQSKKAILRVVGKSIRVCYSILESKEKTDFVCGEILTVLQAPYDTQLVLDAMQGFYTSNQTVDTTEFVHSNLMGTTIIIVLMKDKIFIGSDSRVTSRITETEQMICPERKKVYEITKEPPILATFAGNVSDALQLIYKLQSEAQKLGQHLIKDLIKYAQRHVYREKPRRSFEVFICFNDINDPTFPGHHLEYWPRIMHVEGCPGDDCKCPCTPSMKYSKRSFGVFSMGSGAFIAINYFDKIYDKRIVKIKINSYCLFGDLGVEQETAKDNVFHALFEAALKRPGTGAPFRVDSIINGRVDTEKLNFIPAYKRFRQISREYERGNHLFMVYPSVLEGYNHGNIVFKNFPISREKVIDAGFRLATLTVDGGVHVLRLIGFGMEQNGETPHALQALEKIRLQTHFVEGRKAKSYELEVNLDAEVWNKNVYNEVWNKKKWGSNAVIRAQVFMGKPSLQFLNGLQEVYNFQDSSGGSTTGNSGSSSPEVGTSARDVTRGGNHVYRQKNRQCGIEQSHVDLNGVDSSCSITHEGRKPVNFFGNITKSTEKVRMP